MQFRFWDQLSFFWDRKKLEDWSEAAIGGNNGTEQVCNLITLAPNCHSYWGVGAFALKPLPDRCSETKLELEFWWLADYTTKGKHARMINIAQPPELLATAGLDHGPNNVMLVNCETRELLRSGDIITMETDDATLHPLPSLRLLEMQWILNQFLALSGGAEPDGLEKDDDEEEEEGDGDMASVVATSEEWSLEEPTELTLDASTEDNDSSSPRRAAARDQLFAVHDDGTTKHLSDASAQMGVADEFEE